MIMNTDMSTPIIEDSEPERITPVVGIVIKCENEELDEKPSDDMLIWSNAVFIKEDNV